MQKVTQKQRLMLTLIMDMGDTIIMAITLTISDHTITQEEPILTPEDLSTKKPMLHLHQHLHLLTNPNLTRHIPTRPLDL